MREGCLLWSSFSEVGAEVELGDGDECWLIHVLDNVQRLSTLVSVYCLH